MTYSEECYYDSIIKSRILPSRLSETEKSVFSALNEIIRPWAGECLVDIKLSGSRAKGTATNLTSDMDIFISLSSTTSNSLKEIYNSCYARLRENINNVRKQNVSIGVTMNCLNGESINVDVVPAKRQSQYGNDHSLYKNKYDTWVKTNIDTHISQVVNSGRQYDIVALKIWRDLNKINFPSIYLECFALEYLKGKPLSHCISNFYHLLNSIALNIEEKTIYDPANTNNILSDELTKSEKETLARYAANASFQSIFNILR